MWSGMAWANVSCPVTFPSCPAHTTTTRSQHNRSCKKWCMCRTSGSVHPGVFAHSPCLYILLLYSLQLYHAQTMDTVYADEDAYSDKEGVVSMLICR